MLHATTQQLIRKLHELTAAGSLGWKEGERDCSRLETEGYIVEVEAAPPGFRLLNGNGRELEHADADELAAVAWPGGEGTYATGVADMAARAHRVARGAELAISKIMSALSAPAKKPEPAPKPPAQAVPPAPFGNTDSFAKPAPPAPVTVPVPAPAPAPTPTPIVAAPPPPRPTQPAMTSISARSVQTAELTSQAELQRMVTPPPKPAPEPAPAPAPAPVAIAPAPAPPQGPNIYKPWN